MKNAVQIGAARQKSCEMLENPLQGPVWDQFLPVVQAQAGRQIKGPKANLDKSDSISCFLPPGSSIGRPWDGTFQQIP